MWADYCRRRQIIAEGNDNWAALLLLHYDQQRVSSSLLPIPLPQLFFSRYIRRAFVTDRDVLRRGNAPRAAHSTRQPLAFIASSMHALASGEHAVQNGKVLHVQHCTLASGGALLSRPPFYTSARCCCCCCYCYCCRRD